MNPRTPVFGLPIWCLLSLWIFFGCVELAEQLHLVPEAGAEDQEHPDLDADALSQLAAGLKPDVQNFAVPACASVIAQIAEPTCFIFLTAIHRSKRPMLHDPPSLRLHQKVSVYRI